MTTLQIPKEHRDLMTAVRQRVKDEGIGLVGLAGILRRKKPALSQWGRTVPVPELIEPLLRLYLRDGLGAVDRFLQRGGQEPAELPPWLDEEWRSMHRAEKMKLQIDKLQREFPQSHAWETIESILDGIVKLSDEEWRQLAGEDERKRYKKMRGKRTTKVS